MKWIFYVFVLYVLVSLSQLIGLKGIVLLFIGIYALGICMFIKNNKENAVEKDKHIKLIQSSELYKIVISEINSRRKNNNLIIDRICCNGTYLRISVFSTSTYSQCENYKIIFNDYGYAPLAEKKKEFIEAILLELNSQEELYKFVEGGTYDDDWCDYIVYKNELPKKEQEGKRLY